MAAPVRAHEWMLRELTRNLLHNAIKHSPAGGALSVRVIADANSVALTLARQRARHPRRAASPAVPAVLSRAMRAAARAWAWRSATRSCARWAARISLDNREAHGRIEGLDATVRLPLADNEA